MTLDRVEYQREWRRRRMADPEYRAADLARAREWRKAKRDNDPDFAARERETARRWRQAHPEKRSAARARWYRRNRDKVLAKQSAYYQATREERLLAEKFRKYGIEPDEYRALLARQDGICAICRQPETVVIQGKPQPLAVDHDHETGGVRGLLCSACNLALGGFRDSPRLLLAAISYLEVAR